MSPGSPRGPPGEFFLVHFEGPRGRGFGSVQRPRLGGGFWDRFWRLCRSRLWGLGGGFYLDKIHIMTPSKEAETEPKKSLFEVPFEGGVLAVRITILGSRFLMKKGYLGRDRRVPDLAPSGGTKSYLAKAK